MIRKRLPTLITGLVLIVVLVILRLIFPRLLPGTAGQVAAFLTVFLAILLAFIFFGVFLVSLWLSGKVPRRTYQLVEGVIIAGILLGAFGMFQPWLRFGYQRGFALLFYSTLAFIVWSHITPKNNR
ncbi:MAG: hypothetical protein ACP5SI_06775 [Chloroflexia bacterium]